MSHYASLQIAEYPVWDMRNVADPFVMGLFHKSDKLVYTQNVEDEEVTTHEYRVATARFVTRLEILGYTLDATVRSFLSGIQNLPEEMNLNDHETHLFTNLDFDTWQECMRLIISNDISGFNVEKKLNMLSLPGDTADYIRFTLGKFVFEEAGLAPEYYFSGGFYLGFSLVWDPVLASTSPPKAELGHVFRAVCQAAGSGSTVRFDYTSLIDWGTYSVDEDITEFPERTIVLTEGSSDRQIIEETLDIMHPDLAKYFTFLDFDLPNLAGGSSALVHLLKGFIAAGIRSRIVALFDNDTAARESLRSLPQTDLPDNLRVLTLPELEMARRYPTIGPQGKVLLDINGLAASIELFLGSDILTGSDNELLPVQWKGYNSALEQYHGEILDKRRIQSDYLELLEKVRSGKLERRDHDWSSMEILLTYLFQAYCQPPALPI